MISPTLPLFPLPNTVLFPGVFLPLHIFEPRYLAMVQDALDDDRLIGMTLLKPGFEAEYEGAPPVYPIGCAGLITHAEPLSDGRFNIILQGLERFRVIAEEHSRPYRIGHVELLDTLGAPADPMSVQGLRQRVETLIAPMVERAGGELSIPPSMPDADLIHALAQYLDFEPLEKQALLECPGLVARAAALIDLLEIKSCGGRTPPTLARH
jgi:Lon protease-like protein